MAYTLHRKSAWIQALAQANQTLPEPAALVLRVANLDPTAANANDLTDWPVVSGTPTATQVQFTGTPQSPSSTLTFGTHPAADTQILVDYVPVGAIPASQ